MDGGDSEVERRVSSRVDDGGSQRRGAAESRRRMCAEVRSQGGGAVWRRGDVVGRPGEDYADLNLEDCSAVRRR